MVAHYAVELEELIESKSVGPTSTQTQYISWTNGNALVLIVFLVYLAYCGVV